MLAACSPNAAPDMRASEQMLGAKPDLTRIYRVGIGDKLKITVYGETDLSGQFEINALGAMSLPLIGEVPARGQSLQDLKEAITLRLSDGYLREPKVSVEVLNYRPFYVHGEVRSGGEYAFKNGVTIRDAVAIAGGYTYRANQGYVLMIREGDNREHRINLPSTAMVLPGDNIRVPERYF